MGLETGKEFFESAYELGDKRIEAGFGWPIKTVGAEIRDFASIIKKQIKAGKVLDIGCGEGRISIFFAKNGFDAYGIDFSETAIKRAKNFAKREGVSDKCHFEVMNALELKFPGRFFDVAVDWSVFDHIEPENWSHYLRNLLRVLKPGGFYVLTAFSENTDFIKERQDKWYYSGDAYFHFFSEPDIRKIFGKYFSIMKIREKLEARPPPPFVFFHVLMKKKI